MSSGGGPLLAGWYPDPSDREVERFWDGDDWTAKTRPRRLLSSPPPARPAPSRPRPEREPMSSVDVMGYIFAVVLPIVGFILGLTQINRSRHGVKVVGLSVIMVFVYAWLFSR